MNEEAHGANLAVIKKSLQSQRKDLEQLNRQVRNGRDWSDETMTYHVLRRKAMRKAYDHLHRQYLNDLVAVSPRLKLGKERARAS